MAQTYVGTKGRFWLKTQPLFQAGLQARMAGKFAIVMAVTPIRHPQPQQQPDVGNTAYHRKVRPQRCSGKSPFHYLACYGESLQSMIKGLSRRLKILGCQQSGSDNHQSSTNFVDQPK